jgi:negative regulator of flagellin synthesis FlgM
VTSIGGDSTKPVSPASAQEPGASGPATPQRPTAPSARAVKVEISAPSAHLQQLDQGLNDVGVVDSARVDAAKQAIIEGRFVVDPEIVADKLLVTVREYFLTQQKS